MDYIDPNGRLVPGQWRAEGTGSGVVDVPNLRGQRSSGDAVSMRDALKDYVNSSIGSVE